MSQFIDACHNFNVDMEAPAKVQKSFQAMNATLHLVVQRMTTFQGTFDDTLDNVIAQFAEYSQSPRSSSEVVC
jgi:hypothetical protein